MVTFFETLGGTYRQKGKATCSVHLIRRATLEAVLLDDLRRVTHFARQNEALFAEHIGQKCKAESQREMRRLRLRHSGRWPALFAGDGCSRYARRLLPV